MVRECRDNSVGYSDGGSMVVVVVVGGSVLLLMMDVASLLYAGSNSETTVVSGDGGGWIRVVSDVGMWCGYVVDGWWWLWCCWAKQTAYPSIHTD